MPFNHPTKKPLKMTTPRPLPVALKIWIAGVLLGPLMLYLGDQVLGILRLNLFESGELRDLMGMWFLLVFFGGICSVPSLLVLWLFLDIFLRKMDIRKPFFWIVLAVFTLVLTALPFFFLMGGTWRQGKIPQLFGFTSAYLIAIWAGVYWAFRGLNTGTEEDTTEPLDANL